ncbi:MAG: hypothetical protein QOD66_3912 [Solirubrobacteraceae bacterium]|jgi:hypothetical protein|nr:hypothetical protein [Solirubrobacteraceae bacterium]
MSVRKIVTVLAVGCAGLLAAPVAASAQTTPTVVNAASLNTVPMTGTAHNGKHFAGKFTIDRFVTRNGKSYGVGTLTGHLGNRFVRRTNVLLPVSVGRNGLAGTAATCPILHLVLGPLDLNLLGLQVHLNQVVLDITAQSGPGNLLGNLLCSVANLLNGQSLLTQQITGLLNIFQQLLGIPSLITL